MKEASFINVLKKTRFNSYILLIEEFILILNYI